jgi:transposase
MEKEVTLIMTQKQINRYHVIMDSLEGKLSVAAAAEALGISERQMTRLRNGVKKEGAAHLIHKNKGRTPAHTVTEEEKQAIVELYRGEKYVGANFVHFSELLAEHEEISLSRPTVHRVLKSAGIESPKKRRRFKAHRSRKRKAQEGLMVQLDATPYKWFGGNAVFALHGSIDDATGNITGAYMTKNECLHGYYEVMRQTIERNGVPVSVYADMHTIFRSPNAGKVTIEEQLEGKAVNDTQFGRAMKELGITLIGARSPQAKGRIERLWDTLQSRLIIEFRIQNIKTTHDANAFLIDYIPKFNEKFAVNPELAEKAYVPNTQDLDIILSVKETRTADNGGVFSFSGKPWKIIGYDVPGKTKVEVVASARCGLLALHKGKRHDVAPFVKPEKAKKPKADRLMVKPAEDHPFRQSIHQMPLYSTDLAYPEIHKMLEDIFLSKYA